MSMIIMVKEISVNFRLGSDDLESVEKLCEDEYVPRAAYLRGCVLKDLARRGY